MHITHVASDTWRGLGGDDICMEVDAEAAPTASGRNHVPPGSQPVLPDSSGMEALDSEGTDDPDTLEERVAQVRLPRLRIPLDTACPLQLAPIKCPCSTHVTPPYHHRHPTHTCPQAPDPLYDAGADDRDEAWMDAQRQGRQTDALLSCPSCFTTVCIDCQQVRACVASWDVVCLANQPHMGVVGLVFESGGVVGGRWRLHEWRMVADGHRTPGPGHNPHS